MEKTVQARHSLRRVTLLSLLAVLAACCLVPTAQALGQEGEADYGDSYTEAELEALSTAMRAGNMTLSDLQFDKDYAQGYECYQGVRHMMDDPLYIATFMDSMEYAVGNSASDLLRIMINADSLSREEHYSGWVDMADRPAPRDIDELLQLIVMAANLPRPQLSEEEHALLRSEIVQAMAWHDIEPDREHIDDEGEAAVDQEALYELMKRAAARPGIEYQELFNLEGSLYAMAQLHDVFPTDKVKVVQTPFGQMALGTPGDDYYHGDFAILIDPGGNDTYHNCRIGAAYGQRSYGPRLADGLEATGASADFSPLGDGSFGFFLDMGGDDFYDCYDVDITLGAAVMGTGLFYDLGRGNDRYEAGSVSLGAAMCGIAGFYDDGGSDTYRSKAYSQGAAGFGSAVMYDDSLAAAPKFDTAEGNDGVIDAHERNPWENEDILARVDNDILSAWTESQGFARTSGIALCINKRGNEIYEAGGVYLHAPLFADRYQSFSQGFAIGERDIDYAGGIAMLIDQDGNDRYLGDIYNQGVGYWYSGGFLWDGAGNDLYEMTQYGQGSGIHLAVGGLVDVSGTDTYVMHSGLGQGGSHDFAASILHDRGGDDRYFGNTSCNGCGLTNSVGIHIDRAGNDTYASRKGGGLNSGRPARNTTSIGVLVDMAGTDSYLADGGQEDSSMWTNSHLGMGWDIAPPPEEEESPNTSGPNQPPGEDVEMPEVIAYEGELTQEVFDELWEIAIRWEVGENRVIVPHARDRIVAFGMPVLPYVVNEMEDDYSLAVRAFNDIYPKLMELDRDAVLDAIRGASQSDVYTQRNCVLRVIGDLKLTELEDVVTGYFDDPKLRRRAIGVIGMIGSHAADEELLAMLRDQTTDEKDLQAAIASAASLELECGRDFIKLLSHPMVTVRECVSGQLRAHWDAYSAVVYDALPSAGDLPAGDEGDQVTETRMLLTTLQRLTEIPPVEATDRVALLLSNEDWGVRADAVLLIKHWHGMELEGETRKAVAAYYNGLSQRMEKEEHPYVIHAWQREY